MIRGPRSWRMAAAIVLASATHAGCMLGETASTAGGAGGSGGGGASGGATTTTTTTTTTTPTMLTCPESVTIPPIAMGECDLLQQNCLPGETCVPTVDGQSTICRKEGGLKGAGKPCTINAECQAGLFCVGVCSRPCCPTTDEPCNGGDCNTEVSFQGGLKVLMCSYSEQCTLFEPDTCKEGQKCQLAYPAQGLAVCTFEALDEVPDGGLCQYINECSSMSLCYLGLCQYSCKIGGGGAPGAGGCPAGKTCVEMNPPAAGDIGICQ